MANAILQDRSTRELLNSLDAVKHSYGEADGSRKLLALRVLRTRDIREQSR